MSRRRVRRRAIRSAMFAPVRVELLNGGAARPVTLGKEVLDMCRATVGRHGGVDDIAPIIVFLGSPEAGWITGQDIQVDAGFINSISPGHPSNCRFAIL